jgi:hypothetical protein
MRDTLSIRLLVSSPSQIEFCSWSYLYKQVSSCGVKRFSCGVKSFSCGDLRHRFHYHHHHLHIGHKKVYNDLSQMNRLRNTISIQGTSLDSTLA